LKLISLSVLGYRQFLEKSEVIFPQGMTGICGPNGAGKSKLIEAIGFALYGPRTQILPTGDKREFIPSLAAIHPQTEVVLTIEVKEEQYVITRTLTKAEIRIAGAADVLATTPKGVTIFVTRLLRLSAEAFVGTFVARQNEVAKLHTLDKKPRVDLIHRLIGISQLQVAIELAEKKLEEQKQDTRRAEGALTTTSTTIQAEIVSFEDGLNDVLADEKKVALELASCAAQVQDKKKALDEAIGRRQQKDAKGRELNLLNTSHQQTLSRYSSVRSDWERATAALARQSAINAELTDLTSVEADFQHWDLMNTREVYLQQQRSLREQFDNQLKPSHELLLRTRDEQQELEKEIAQVVEKISTNKAKLALATHRKSEARKLLALSEKKRIGMVEIGPGGICENCGMTLSENSYGVALGACDQAITRHQMEENEAEQEENQHFEHTQALNRTHTSLQTRKVDIEARLQRLVNVPGQIEALEKSLADSDEQVRSLGIDEYVEPFSQISYDHARERLEYKKQIISELSGLAIVAGQESRHRTELAEVTNWLAELAAKIQILEDEIQRLVADEASDRATEEAFKIIEEKHRQLVQRERDALQFRVQAEMRLEERRQYFETIKSAEMKLEVLRLKQLTAERTLELLRQMLTEINDEARPRLAELMDTWLRSLIGEKFQAVTLSEDYRVQADCGAGFRLLDHFSGGEQTLLSVMLRVAISLFCQERAGFDTSFLILDEVFGNQDVVHRNQLVEFLTEIQKHYHQILIVNHVEDVTQMLDTIIEVVPITSNTSRITMASATL
jgi:exonuclease SbcC